MEESPLSFFSTVVDEAPLGGVPNHAITQIFFRFHAFTQREENLGFHAISQNLFENWSFHEITQEKFNFHEFTQNLYAFHASRMEVISRIHADFFRFHAFTQKKGQSHRPMGASMKHMVGIPKSLAEFKNILGFKI